MKTSALKLYEAMFLVSSVAVEADRDGVLETIKNILGRVNAEVLSLKKWDERKLAYKIEGQTRATYFLCYFRAEGSSIKEIKRYAELSELIMRVLILNTEKLKMTEQDIPEQTPVTQTEKTQPEQQDQTAQEQSTEPPSGQASEAELQPEPTEAAKDFSGEKTDAQQQPQQPEPEQEHSENREKTE